MDTISWNFLSKKKKKRVLYNYSFSINMVDLGIKSNFQINKQ